MKRGNKTGFSSDSSGDTPACGMAPGRIAGFHSMAVKTDLTARQFPFSNLHFSEGFVARRRKRMWMQGLRPRTPEAYFKYVEESEGA
jgi:hypothetical protein